MQDGVLKKIVLIVFSLACVLCVLGIGFALFDSVRNASGSNLNGLGILAVYIMALLMAVRWVWAKRQID